MQDDLLDALAAVEWAESNLPAFQRRIDAWLYANCTAFIKEVPTNAAYDLVVVRVDEPLPRALSVEAGALINTLRTSLDILMYAIAMREPGPFLDKDKIYFPVADSAALFRSGSYKGSRCLAQCAGAVAEAMNDFDRGDLGARLTMLADKHPKIAKAAARAPRHLGTLGTGNHFIEVCLDEENAVWVMLHSGSRGIGNQIGQYFIERAKEDMRRWFINLPDQDLAYLSEGSQNFDDYVEAVEWAQNFALENRSLMLAATMRAIQNALGREFEWGSVAVNCHHNYVSKEHHFGANVWVTRKGAVRAREGDLGIIPGSMGARSFIVRGKGNPDSFHTCSHGAGRAMSRAEAKRRFTLADHEKATEGIECRKDVDVIDETPMAYKDIDAVMAAQSDLVEIVHTLHQVVCVKG